MILDNAWVTWRAATCMPSHCFCEAVRSGWIRQPANTFSSLAFVVVAILIARRERTARSVLYVGALLIIGLGSAFYHASLTFVGQFFDVFGMYLLATFVLVQAAGRKWQLRNRSVIVAYVASNVALALLLIYLPNLRRYLFAGVILLALLIEASVPRAAGRRDLRPLLQSTAILGIAFVVWSLDLMHVVCWPHSIVQGHALWHVLGAVAAGVLFQFYATTSAPARSVRSGKTHTR